MYLDLLRENLALHEVLLVGYCLMVQSCSFNCDSYRCRRIGILHEAYAWALCVLLECGPQFESTCLARTILLTSVGWAAFVGSIALHGAESGASTIGDEAQAWA